jgi:CheY-like chemotaxis protein
VRCTPALVTAPRSRLPIVPESFRLAPAGLAATARSLRLRLSLSEKGTVDVYLGGVSVLVVDDCKLVRGTIVAMLEHYGASVTAVGSAEAAVEALLRERPDVLVSDIAMPDKGGYWLIRKVRALPPEQGGGTPAAALTGFTGPEHRASILRAGFQYHIEKPVSLENLAGIVALLALKAEIPSANH